MLTEILADLRNYFCQDADKHFGEFTISGGSIAPLDFLQPGQYFRIVGSVHNDGVYQYGATGTALIDETFDGAVWAMAVPPAVVALAAEIEEYRNNPENKPGGYASESFGGYSYNKVVGKNGGVMSWREAFSDRLNQWRKVRA